jgi:hypothetical protein
MNETNLQCLSPAEFLKLATHYVQFEQTQRRILYVTLYVLILVLVCITIIYTDRSWLNVLYGKYNQESSFENDTTQLHIQSVLAHDRSQWMWAHLHCVRAVQRIDEDNDCSLCHTFWYHQSVKDDFQLAYESYRRFIYCDGVSGDVHTLDQDACIHEWYREWHDHKEMKPATYDYSSYRSAMVQCTSLLDIERVHNSMRMCNCL